MQRTNATPQIFVMGRIIKAKNFDSDEIFVKYWILFGTNFKLLEGGEKGETFQGVAQYGETEIFFDHPINFNMSCRSIKGWPKILLEVWATDEHGRNHLIGYGTAFIPFKKGCNKISVQCWRPSDKISGNISESFLGNTPEFVDRSAVVSSEEKFGMYTFSTGTVELELDLLMKDFHLHGIKIN
jgi:B9 domain-containing protein 2